MSEKSPDRPVFMRKGELLPPPRPGVRHVRLPLVSLIIIADDRLRGRINRRFHWPMLTLALLMLPFLVVEFGFRPLPGTWLWWCNWVALTLIWIAFFIEFLVKVTIAECRIEYCKRNWLDILILVLPAMRSLRIAQVTRTSRLFTLRGVGMKVARLIFTIVIGLEATDRLLHRVGIKRKRKGRKDPERMTRHQLMQEVKRQRRKSDDWEDWYDEHLAHLDERGVVLYVDQREHLSDPPQMAPGAEAGDDASPDPVVRLEAPADDEPTMPPTCESPSPN